MELFHIGNNLPEDIFLILAEVIMMQLFSDMKI